MRAIALVLVAVAAGVVVAAPSPQATSQGSPQVAFPHERHANLFPLCATCHAGVAEPGQSLWPQPAQCASCHDGTVAARVAWTPREAPRAGNLRFSHDAHDRATTAANPADSGAIAVCGACHTPGTAPRMSVRHAVVENCLDCHGVRESHVDAPASACATCHLPLSDARSLTAARIRAFPRPQSHNDPDFTLGVHGANAPGPGGVGVAASCATCHSRNLCIECHVNAPESRPIQSLGLDMRVPAREREQPVPPSHASPHFSRLHGKQAQPDAVTCATCHTRESCSTCHAVAPPRAVTALPTSGAGRADGAHLTRKPPSSHTPDFRQHHDGEANARPATCETCHERSMCLQCHRPGNASQNAFHPRGFLARHPTAAFSRAANCSDCHNAAQFCQACHQQSGLVARGRLGPAGYHDAFRGFSLGHGQAARQNLESCASCHAERDCAACHAAGGGGFRFNPHGPGFNAERLRSRSPSMCAACHGPAR